MEGGEKRRDEVREEGGWREGREGREEGRDGGREDCVSVLCYRTSPLQCC